MNENNKWIFMTKYVSSDIENQDFFWRKIIITGYFPTLIREVIYTHSCVSVGSWWCLSSDSLTTWHKPPNWGPGLLLDFLCLLFKCPLIADGSLAVERYSLEDLRSRSITQLSLTQLSLIRNILIFLLWYVLGVKKSEVNMP